MIRRTISAQIGAATSGAFEFQASNLHSELFTLQFTELFNLNFMEVS